MLGMTFLLFQLYPQKNYMMFVFFLKKDYIDVILLIKLMQIFLDFSVNMKFFKNN